MEKGTAGRLFPGTDADLQWWQKTVIYQIYPRSFKDSTGNGVGDLPGIISKLDYLQYLGIESIWISPIYPSPMKDHGYDVSNYKDIEPLFGTLKDFDALVGEIRKRRMKLIMDIIPSHSSDKHPWFQESRKGGEGNRYDEYYMWNDGKVNEAGEREPPNQKRAIFGGPAWTWDEVRQQYFHHRFLPEQPDLNWNSTAVQDELKDVFKFWLDRGVDGFRVDAMRNSEQAYEIVQQWRDFFDEYEKSEKREHIFMVVELYDETMNYSMRFYNTGADGPFNFNLLGLRASSLSGQTIEGLAGSWLARMPVGKWPNFVLGNHDQARIASKVGAQYVDALNLLLLLLPGTPTVYQGDEIGMEDVDVTWEQTQDPWALNMGKENYRKYTRDVSRAPLSWSSERNAGFTEADSTWLPIDPRYKEKNIQLQMGTENSSLQLFRSAVKLRQHPSFQRGSMHFSLVTDHILSFVREYQDSKPSDPEAQDQKSPDSTSPEHGAFLVALNVGNSRKTCNFHREGGSGKVVLATPGAGFQKDAVLGLNAVTLDPGQGVVMQIFPGSGSWFPCAML